MIEEDDIRITVKFWNIMAGNLGASKKAIGKLNSILDLCLADRPTAASLTEVPRRGRQVLDAAARARGYRMIAESESAWHAEALNSHSRAVLLVHESQDVVHGEAYRLGQDEKTCFIAGPHDRVTAEVASATIMLDSRPFTLAGVRTPAAGKNVAHEAAIAWARGLYDAFGATILGGDWCQFTTDGSPITTPSQYYAPFRELPLAEAPARPWTHNHMNSKRQAHRIDHVLGALPPDVSAVTRTVAPEQIRQTAGHIGLASDHSRLETTVTIPRQSRAANN